MAGPKDPGGAFMDSGSDRYRRADKMLGTAIGKKVQQYLQDEFISQVEYVHPYFFADAQEQDKLWQKMIQRNIIDGEPFISRCLSPRSSLSPELKLCFRSEKRGTHLQSRPAPLFPEFECKPLGSLGSTVTDTFGEVRNAVNDRKDRTNKSFSKYLVIPLFKYARGDPVLYVRDIWTNTLTLSVEISGYSWIKELTGDRAYHDVLSIDLPLNSINDLAAIERAVEEALSPDGGSVMMDLDDIDIIGVQGYAVDVSRLCRDDFRDLTGTSLKAQTSFIVDGEVVADCAAPGLVVTSSETIQFIRMLTLFAIGADHGSRRKLMDAYRNGALERWIPPGQGAVERIDRHLASNWQEEQSAYSRVFERYDVRSRYPAFDLLNAGIHELLGCGRLYDLIAQIHAETDLFKDEELYQAMVRIAGAPIRRA